MKPKHLLLMINAAFVVENVLLYAAMNFQRPSNQLLGQLPHDFGVLVISLGSIVTCLVWCIPLFACKARIGYYALPLVGLFVWSYAAYDVFADEFRTTPSYWQLVYVHSETESQISIEGVGILSQNNPMQCVSGSDWGDQDYIKLKWWRGKEENRPQNPNHVLLRPDVSERGDSIEVFITEKDGYITFSCAAKPPPQLDQLKRHVKESPRIATPGIVLSESQ